MTAKEFEILRGELNFKCEELLHKKGQVYRRNEDTLGNFRRRATEAGISPRQVWLVLAGKGWDAIVSIVNGAADVEGLYSRIVDLRNYLDLLYALEKEWPNSATTSNPEPDSKPATSGNPSST